MSRTDGALRRVIVLGSTGSIGVQTLETIDHLNALHTRERHACRYEIVGLAAGTRDDLLSAQSQRWPAAATVLSARDGVDAPRRLVAQTEADVVVAAMVGFAGIPATLEAARLGRSIALANKETLVAAGTLVISACARSGARLLPVDSEHAGLWQCLGQSVGPSLRAAAAPPLSPPASLRRAIITASGGPFRTWSHAEIDGATPAQALNHPTWRMGPKVTVDSASLMNKALELVEAHWLFGLTADRLGVLVHAQSQVHAMVEWNDGTSIAQVAPADMRLPILRALAWPEPAEGFVASQRDAACAWTFESPDVERFPAVDLGYRAIREGGSSGAVMNAANEVAVEAFLKHGLRFGRIASVVTNAMDAFPATRIEHMDHLIEIDRRAREFAANEVRRSPS